MKTALKIIALLLLVAFIIGGIPTAGIMIICGVGGTDNSLAGGGLIVLLLVIGCLIGAINILRSLPRKTADETPEDKA